MLQSLTRCVMLQSLTLCVMLQSLTQCVMLQSLTELKVKLREVDRRIPLPAEATNTVWEHCICLVNRTFVEG